MSSSKQSGKSLVIQGYLNGNSMDQIASETNVSKGKVHYLINNWKKEIGEPDIGTLREFSIKVRKSRISIGQCAQGFRMISILKNLGIHEDNDNDGIDNKYEGNYDEFSSFIEDVYKDCKKEGVEPSSIPAWVKDLFDFYGTSPNSKNKSPFSANGDYDDFDNGGNKSAQPKVTVSGLDNTTSTLQSQHHQPQKTDNTSGFSSQEGDGDDNGPNSLTSSKENHPDAKSKQTASPSSSFPYPNDETEMPFVSRISFYIDQMKKEYSEAEKHRKKVMEEINELGLQRTQAEENLAITNKREKNTMIYLHIFAELKKVLRDTYDINTDEGIKELANLIHDFQEKGYDAAKIISEYKNSLSLKFEITENQKEVNELYKQKNSLQNLVSSLYSQASMHRQTMGVYGQLQAMNFGLTELKQIWNTILEIAGTRKDSITSQEAISLFIRDIEENYHDKFLLEDKVKEKRNELFRTEQELNNNRLALQLTPFVGTTLQRLFQNGINENDIISISQIVTETANGKLQLGPQGEVNKHSQAVNGSNSDIDNSSKRTEYWKSFIENLRKLGSINSTIKKQQETLEKTKREIIDLGKQKQDLSSQCQTTVSFIGLAAKHIHHFNWLIDYYYNTTTRKIKVSPITLSPLLINLIYVNSDNLHKDDKAEDGKK